VRGPEEILHMQFVMTSLYCHMQLCHCGVCYCQLLGWAFSVLPQAHFDAVSVTSGDAQFVCFHVKTFVFLGNTLFENCLSFGEKNKLFCCLIFENMLYRISSSFCIFHSLSKLSSILSISFQLSVNCGN